MALHETSFPFLFERFFATIEVDYETFPKQDLYEWEFSHFNVRVTSLVGDTWEKNREELEASGWAQGLDDKVTDLCLEMFYRGDWIRGELVDE